MIDALTRQRPRVRRLAIGSTALVAAVVSTAACTDAGPSPDEQRERVITTGEVAVAVTSDDMVADTVEVTDDATTLRACPDGGYRYTYAATVGPADWESYADSPVRALSSTYNSILGRMLGMHSDPELAGFPRFDDRSFTEPATAEEPRSSTYRVTEGDDMGISLTYVVRLAEDDEVHTDITVQTRCG